MGFMENVRPRGKNGTYYVVKRIPVAARHAFRGSAQQWVSLRTTDKTSAMKRAVEVLSDLDARVAAALAQSTAIAAQPSLPAPPAPRVVIHKERLLETVERWRLATIDASFTAHLNNLAPSAPEDAAALSDLTYKLKVRDYDGIATLYDKFAEALVAFGLAADPAHPALPRLRHHFAEAWLSVLTHEERFRWGDFDQWPEDDHIVAKPPAEEPAKPVSTLRVMEAFDQWVAIEQPKEPERVRTYFKLLVSYLGDKPMADIDHYDLDRFKLELRKYPFTKKDVSALGFLEVIAKFERDEPGYPRLSDRTQYGYWRHYNIVWKFAHGRRMIPFNPVAAVMPKKPAPSTKRKPYDAADVEVIFSTPLFHGATKMLDKRGNRWAYAKTPGDVLVKDANYWLPIFALWHGVRMEEIGGARVSELVKVGDRWAFDWTDRTNLKNDTSARILPIHKKLIELGFVEYIQSQPKGGFIFPELPHDPKDEEAATRQFSKWWGLWCTANAKVKGQGIDEPVVKVFHSFRHSFKRAARGRVEKPISDLLSGHKGTNDVSQKYGFGAEFDVLVEAIDKIEFPTFPTTLP